MGRKVIEIGELIGLDFRPHTVYSILNKANGKRYVGMTSSPESRKKSHFNQLRGGYHWNKRLQVAFDEFGEDSFIWEAIETNIPDKRAAHQRERKWIGHFDSFRNGYNGSDGIHTNTEFWERRRNAE